MRQLALLEIPVILVLMSGCVQPKVTSTTVPISGSPTVSSVDHPTVSPTDFSSTRTPEIRITPSLTPTIPVEIPPGIDDILILSSRHRPGAANNAGIFLVHTNCIYLKEGCSGETEHILAEDEFFYIFPKWSADGELIAFLSDRDNSERLLNLYIMEDGTKTIKRITYGEGYREQHTWSPTKPMIAYVNRPHNDWRSAIAIIDLEIGTGWQIPSDINFIHPSWSPTGDRLAFLGYTFDEGRGTDLFISDLYGEEIIRLTHGKQINGDPPAWSPNGDQIAYSTRLNGTSVIELITLNTMEILRLTDENVNSLNPVWSPNSGQIAYVSNKYFDGEYSDLNIFLMDSDGKNIIQITEDKFEESHVQWAIDGNYIMYLLFEGSSYDSHLYLSSPIGEWSKRIDTPFTVASFSVKGQGDG